MATATKRQDMPPPGGYKPIQFKRIPAKTFFNGWAMIGGYLGMTAGAAYVYFLNYKAVHKDEIEERSAEFALYPLLLAERDREYLRQLRRNRDEEAKLMANVEGWKVGTWFGEPIYKTKPKDYFVQPYFYEFYAHVSDKDRDKRGEISLWS